MVHCGVYLDWLNIKMNGGRELSFDKLLEYIRAQGGFIRCANFYAPEAEGNQMGLYDAARRSGFRIAIVPGKVYGENKSFDCDVMMAVDMVVQGAHFDVVYLLTHDADFLPAVRHLQSQGVRVVLLHADKPSNELRDAVDEWHHLGQFGILPERSAPDVRR
jgi:uncharacterized LabA/DUF88 family protein